MTTRPQCLQGWPCLRCVCLWESMCQKDASLLYSPKEDRGEILQKCEEGDRSKHRRLVVKRANFISHLSDTDTRSCCFVGKLTMAWWLWRGTSNSSGKIELKGKLSTKKSWNPFIIHSFLKNLMPLKSLSFGDDHGSKMTCRKSCRTGEHLEQRGRKPLKGEI